MPTGRSVPTLGALLPGARLALPDVGGTSGMQNRDLTVHGSDGRDTTFQVDGMTLERASKATAASRATSTR